MKTREVCSAFLTLLRGPPRGAYRDRPTLRSTGKVEFRYETLPPTGTARVGVGAGNRLDRYPVTGYDGAVVASNAQDANLSAAGVSTLASYTYNALDQLTGGAASGLTYSSDGEMETITGPAPRGSWSLGYDAHHLMTSATSGPNTTTWTFDGFARVVKTTKAGTETRYRYSGAGGPPSFEEDASGTVTAVHVGGPGGLLGTYTASGPTYLLSDGHGAVVRSLDESGTAAGTFAYDEFGLPTSPDTTKYGYTGSHQKERDPDTGLVRMGVRMYDPVLGRFTSWDPVPGGSLNPYDYSAQDPINNVDLDGRKVMADGGSSHYDTCQYAACDHATNRGGYTPSGTKHYTYYQSTRNPTPRTHRSPSRGWRKWASRASTVLTVVAIRIAPALPVASLVAMSAAFLLQEAVILSSDQSGSQKLGATALNLVSTLTGGVIRPIASSVASGVCLETCA